MLDLDSPRWRTLRHAYGAADDIPPRITQLQTVASPKPDDWDEEPWLSLWSALCHQDDVYTASYAAVPHLVRIAASRAPHERGAFVHFVAWVEVCRQSGRGPAIPADLADAYSDALRQAARTTLESLALAWDTEAYRVLLGGLAVFQGHAPLAATIIDPPDEIECPHCGTLFPSPGHALFDDAVEEQ